MKPLACQARYHRLFIYNLIFSHDQSIEKAHQGAERVRETVGIASGSILDIAYLAIYNCTIYFLRGVDCLIKVTLVLVIIELFVENARFLWTNGSQRD